jgi:hypothetical protein
LVLFVSRIILIATAQAGIEEGGEEEETRGKRQKSNVR